MNRQPYLHNLASLMLALEAQRMALGQGASSEKPTVTIRRDPALQSWVYSSLGAGVVKLPFTDSAPALSVVLYLKTLAEGNINVHVDLG